MKPVLCSQPWKITGLDADYDPPLLRRSSRLAEIPLHLCSADWRLPARLQPITEKRKKLDRRSKPKIGCGLPPVRPNKDAQPAVSQGVEGIFIGLVIAQVRYRSVDPHLR